MNDTAIASSAANRTATSARPVLWWAALGAACLALQLYALGAWVLSPHFVASDPGPDTLSTFAKVMMWLISGSFLLGGIYAFAMLGRTLLRGERFSNVQVLMLGTWTATWQDPTLNAFRPLFVYNSHYWNFGSWSELLPFWASPNGSRMPEPVLWQAGCYVIMQPLLVLFTVQLMRRLHARWPSMGAFKLCFLAMLGCGTFNSINEVVLIFGEVMAYPGVIHAWSIFPDTQYQFPIYEGYIWAAGTTACAALLYFTSADGRTWVEGKLDTLGLPLLAENGLRVLAAGGFINVALFSYILFQLFVSMHIDAWPQMPSYFVSGICGPGTGYPCPSPELPIPTITTPADPALLDSDSSQ